MVVFQWELGILVRPYENAVGIAEVACCFEHLYEAKVLIKSNKNAFHLGKKIFESTNKYLFIF